MPFVIGVHSDSAKKESDINCHHRTDVVDIESLINRSQFISPCPNLLMLTVEKDVSDECYDQRKEDNPHEHVEELPLRLAKLNSQGLQYYLSPLYLQNDSTSNHDVVGHLI